MIILKWICFILVCLDVINYIIKQADKTKNESSSSSKAGRFVGFLLGIASRVYVLYGTATYWLLA